MTLTSDESATGASPTDASEPSPQKAARRRLLPRFGLRFLFVFAVLFCLFFAWVARNIVRMREEDAAIEALLQANATIVVAEGEGMLYKEAWSPEWIDPDERTAGERFGRALAWTGPPRVARVELACEDRQDAKVAPALAGLRMFPELWHVELHGQAFDDRSMERLATAGSVRSLTLESTRVTAEGLASLAPHLRLVSLSIRQDGTGDLIHGAASHRDLITILLSETPLEREDVETIASLPRLQQLFLGSVPFAGKPDLLWPLDQAESLERLSVRANGVDEGAIVKLPPMLQLEELEMHGVELADLPALPNLESFDTKGVTDEALSRWDVPPRLSAISLYPPVSQEVARAFWAEHPGCVVTYYPNDRPAMQWPGQQVLK